MSAEVRYFGVGIVLVFGLTTLVVMADSLSYKQARCEYAPEDGYIQIDFDNGVQERGIAFVSWPAAWSPFAVLLSETICLATGIVFGWYPARQASELDPIKALHAE